MYKKYNTVYKYKMKNGITTMTENVIACNYERHNELKA